MEEKLGEDIDRLVGRLGEKLAVRLAADDFIERAKRIAVAAFCRRINCTEALENIKFALNRNGS